MNNITITGNYQTIDTNGLSKSDIKKKGINDTNFLKDNVLDISNTERLKEELSIESKDINKIKFVKVDSKHYIDLSNPEQKAELINKLKENILDKNNVKSNFSGASFEDNTGIILDFNKSHQVGRILSKTTEIMSNITRSIYDNNYAHPKIFNQIIEKINNQVKEIDSELQKLNTNPTENKNEIEKLNKIKSLAVSIKDAYKLIDNSSKPVSRIQSQNISSQVLTKTRAITASLSELNPDDIGKDNYLKMTNLLEDLTVLSDGFSVHSAIGNADNDLSRFTLKSYERIREIKNKERVRSNETPDMKGAMQSFTNDNKDMQVFMSKISKVTSNIGSYKTKEEAVNAAMKEINAHTLSKSSGGFADSVKNIISGKWEQNVALNEIKLARDKVIKGQDNISNANQHLQAVTGSKNENGNINEGLLQKAGKLYQMSEDKRFNPLEGESKNLLSQVKIESQNIQFHLNEYNRLKNQGLGDLKEAQSHLEQANYASIKAKGYAEKVLQGKYSKELGTQAKAIISQAEQIKIQSNSIMEDIGKLRNIVKETDNVANSANTASESIAVRVDSRQLLDKNIDDIRKNISFQLSNKGVSKEVIEFLANPDKPITTEQKEKYTNELKKAFERNPEIAKSYSDKIMGLKNDMDKFITQRAGNDKAFALNLRNEMVDGLFSRPIGAIFYANSENSAMKPVQQWVMNTRDELSQQLLTHVDENTKKSFNTFDDLVKNNPEIKEKYNEFLANHANNRKDESIPMSIVSDKGFIMNFDVKMVKDNKTGEYCIFNPYDGGVYKAKTPEDAMKNFADNAHLANGKLNYKDTKGGIVSTNIKIPESTLGKDLLMGGAGLVGGILAFVPEPTMLTKVAAGGLIGTSSAYFMHKGVTELAHLSNTERTGWNRETFFATLDVATGFLGVLDGAGLALQATKGGAGILKTSTALAEGASDASKVSTALSEAEKLSLAQSMVKKYVELTVSKGFTGSNLALNGSNITLGTASKIYDISKMNISKEEKAIKIAETLASATIPIGIAVASHSIMMAKTKSDFIETTINQIDKVNKNINQIKLEPVNVDSLKDILTQLDNLEKTIKVKSKIFNDPKLSEIGVERLNNLLDKTKLNFVESAGNQLGKVAENVEQAKLDPINASVLKESVPKLDDVNKGSKLFNDPKLSEIGIEKVTELRTQVQNLMKQGEMIESILNDPEIKEITQKLNKQNIQLESLEEKIQVYRDEINTLNKERKKLIDELKVTNPPPTNPKLIKDKLKELNEKINDLESKTDIEDKNRKILNIEIDKSIEAREKLITEKAPSKDIPIGFKDKEDFQKAIDSYKKVSCVKDFATDTPIIGVRGSSVYGLSPHKGTSFSPKSDIDFFLVSDKLFNEGVKRLKELGINKLDGTYVRKGYLTEEAIKKAFPEFKTTDKEIGVMIGRKAGIRIMTKEQYESIKTGKEVLGQ